MADLERFVHDDTHYFPELLKIALAHYQFETIHPFLDGNGRIGRLMITLYLVSKGILKKPVLYLSDFLERNRVHYYDNLMGVRTKNELEQWFKFFLVGVTETARNGIATFDRILKLQKRVDTQLQTLGSRAAKAFKVVETLYRDPVIDAARAGKVAKLSPASAYKLISDLERLGILKEIKGGKRGRTYTFEPYVKLFR
jgi:Fic family protein